MAPRTGLGEFELAALLATFRLADEAYGMAIKREIETCTGRSVSVGAMYTTLSRLQSKGLVTSDLGPATAERGGRAKTFYMISPAGKQMLDVSVQRFKGLTVGVPALEAK